MKKLLIIIGMVVAGLSSCKKETTAFYDPNPHAIADDATIQAYLKANNITTAVQDPSGLYYQVIIPGNGIYPTASSNVTVAYTGTLINGTQFDSNTAFTTALTSVIRGWTIGLQHVKVGGRIKLFVPSTMGYRDMATGAIPANSVLLFTIDLISIN